MMKNLRHEEESIIKDKRNLFRLKTEQNYIKKKLKQLKIEYLRILVSMKKKQKIIINQ